MVECKERHIWSEHRKLKDTLECIMCGKQKECNTGVITIFHDGSGADHKILILPEYMPIILDVIHRMERLTREGSMIAMTERSIYCPT